MELHEEIDRLRERYQIETENSRRLELLYRECILIRNMWDELKEHKVAIYGAGTHTDILQDIIGDMSCVVCYIDKKACGTVRNGRPVIGLDELSDYQAETLVISAFREREEMKADINALYPQINIVDFYDIIGEEADVKEALKKEMNIRYWDRTRKYQFLNSLCIKLQNCTEEKEKAQAMEDLIACYLAVRDFVQAEILMDQYIQERMYGWERYYELKKGLENIFYKTADHLSNRKEKDIVIYLIDSLGADIAEKMAGVRQFAENGYHFMNYAAEYAQTRYSVFGMMTGINAFEAELFGYREINWEMGDLMPWLKQNGIRVRYLNQSRSFPLEAVSANENGRGCNNLLTEMYFDVLEDMLQDHEPTIYILHEDSMIHSPCFCDCYTRELKSRFDSFEEYEEQFQAAVGWTDQLLKFMTGLLKNCCKAQIIMGDHGHDLRYDYEAYHSREMCRRGRWSDKEIHTFLALQTSEGIVGKNEKIVSNLEFSQIMLALFWKQMGQLDTLGKDELIIRCIPGYGERYLKMLCEGDNLHIAKGYIGLWNPEETWLIFEDGEEYYLRCDVEGKMRNLANTEGYRKAMEQCREKVQDTFPKELLVDDKYGQHNKMFQLYESYQDRIDKLRREEFVTLLYGNGILGSCAMHALKGTDQLTGYCVDKLCCGFEDESGIPYYKLEDIRALDNCQIILATDSLETGEVGLAEERIENWQYLTERQLLLIQQKKGSLELEEKKRLDHILLDYKKRLLPDKLWIHNIDFVITERCSLKCRDCFNMMQYYERPQDYSREYLCETLDLLLEATEEIVELRILGGEPFMNPEIYNILAYASEREQVDHIVVYTNGTILPDVDRINRIGSSKISFFISGYGTVSARYHELCRLLKVQSIPYHASEELSWYKIKHIEEIQKTVEEVRQIYGECYGRDCVTLLKGQLYQCEILANAYNLGMLPENEADRVDLSAHPDPVVRRERVRRYLYETTYLPGCRWCGMKHRNELECVQAGIQCTDVRRREI